MFIPKIIRVLKMLQSFLESRIHKNVHFRSKHQFHEKYTRFQYWDVQFRPNTFYWSKWIFLSKMSTFCESGFSLLEMKNDACLGYTGSKNGWNTIKRFLLYWKIIRVDFPDACFCIISINCDSFVKTSNFINLRCTGNNHVATLYKKLFWQLKLCPKS